MLETRRVGVAIAALRFPELVIKCVLQRSAGHAYGEVHGRYCMQSIAGAEAREEKDKPAGIPRCQVSFSEGLYFENLDKLYLSEVSFENVSSCAQ